MVGGDDADCDPGDVCHAYEELVFNPSAPA
jgi:hypothetical protein